MFNPKTLFVVGAGASQEADLPTSATLRDDIVGQLNIAYELTRLVSGDGQIADSLIKYAKQNGEDVRAYFHAASQLHAALPHAISIDNLIDAHGHDPKIELCGKLGIARSILKAEAASKLKARDSRKDLSPEPDLALLDRTWYRQFSGLLSENVRKEKVATIFENVSFIVFNYDRCVEYYLYHFLQRYYQISDQEVRSLMGKLKILHPYGLVGQLPWQTTTGGTVPFGCDDGRSDLLRIAGQIQTFTEREKNQQFVDAICEEVTSADTIVFLGFAFHRQNMQLLFGATPKRPSHIYATAKGISNSGVEAIQKNLEGLSGSHQIRIGNQLSCAAFFSEFWYNLSGG